MFDNLSLNLLSIIVFQFISYLSMCLLWVVLCYFIPESVYNLSPPFQKSQQKILPFKVFSLYGSLNFPRVLVLLANTSLQRSLYLTNRALQYNRQTLQQIYQFMDKKRFTRKYFQIHSIEHKFLILIELLSVMIL